MDGSNQQSNHHICQTLFGPVCTSPSCLSRVSQNKTNFTCTTNTISTHWRKNNCSTGNPSPSRVERQLVERLRHLHSECIGNKELAFEHFKDGDDGVKRTLRHHCSHCGLVDKPNKLKKQHCAPPYGKGKCPGHPVKAHVLSNKYNQQVPEAFIHEIIAGNSPLLRLRPKWIITSLPNAASPLQIQQPAAVATASPVAISPYPSTATPRTTATASEPTPKRIKVTPAQLERATEQQLRPSPTHRQLQINQDIDSLNIPDAADHQWFLQHLCLDDSRNLKDTLVHNIKLLRTTYSSEDDDPHMKALLRATDLWFKSQSANVDVRNISTHKRAALYKIGIRAEAEEEDLIWGKSFVPTHNDEELRKELKYLNQFLYRGQHINKDLLEALSTIVGSVTYDNNHPDQWLQNIAERILLTDILPAIIINAVLEEPKEANGPTILHDFIAARSFTLRAGDNLDVNSPNSISRSANALLRVVRHAVCTHLNNLSEVHKVDHHHWEKEADELIRQVQTAPSIGHICLRISTAKYEQWKKPTVFNKCTDINTGDIYIAGTTIPHQRWSRTIPHAMELVRGSIELLFQNKGGLEKWLNINNQLVFNGANDNTYVNVPTNDVESIETVIPTQNLVPSLGPTANDDIKAAIDNCFQFQNFCFAYLDGGARGSEVNNIGDFETMQFIFNSLKYDMLSQKGQCHGRQTNKSVAHFLPPSMSRVVILFHLVLWPAVQKSSAYTMPEQSQSSSAAVEFFRKVFNLPKPLGSKNSRQAVASIHNYVLPSKDSQLAVNSVVANKFQHSGPTHSSFYKDQIITKVDGETVDFALMSARRIWDAMGEQHLSPSATSHTNQSPITLTAEHYNYAAKTIYGPHASISSLQLEAIMHLDNSTAGGQFHAFLLAATGSGKSGLYNIPSSAAALFGNQIPKTLIISPHNGLLSQHCQQSTNYFRTLKVTVTSLESSEVSESSDCPPDIDNTNVCFVSICGLHKLRKYHSNTFEQWGFKRIIIDEYHNIISEMFRFESSWEGLRNIAALGVKVVCMSATGNEYIMKCVSRLLGLGPHYKLIGNVDQYKVPEVSILLSTVENRHLLTTVVEEIYRDFDQNRSTNHSAHVIVLSIDDAKKFEAQWTFGSLLANSSVCRGGWSQSEEPNVLCY